MRLFVSMISGALALSGATVASAGEPMCSHFGTDTHGEHVVGDYVTGIGAVLWGDNLGWPPDGSEVGATVSANGGAYIPGGTGPGFHFIEGLAPGASACNTSQSPGIHLPPG